MEKSLGLFPRGMSLAKILIPGRWRGIIGCLSFFKGNLMARRWSRSTSRFAVTYRFCSFARQKRSLLLFWSNIDALVFITKPLLRHWFARRAFITQRRHSPIKIQEEGIDSASVFERNAYLIRLNGDDCFFFFLVIYLSFIYSKICDWNSEITNLNMFLFQKGSWKLTLAKWRCSLHIMKYHNWFEFREFCFWREFWELEGHFLKRDWKAERFDLKILYTSEIWISWKYLGKITILKFV